jgi:hypothetical protein
MSAVASLLGEVTVWLHRRRRMIILGLILVPLLCGLALVLKVGGAA